MLTGCLCYEVTKHKAVSWLPNGNIVYIKETSNLVGSEIKGKTLNHSSNVVEYNIAKDSENILFQGDAQKILTSPNGKYLAMGRSIYNYKGKLIRKLPHIKGMDYIKVVSWSPDSTKVLYVANKLNQEEYRRSKIGIYNILNRYNKVYTKGENPIFVGNNRFLYVDTKRDIDYAYIFNTSTRKSAKTRLMIDLLQNCRLISPHVLLSLSANRIHRISTKSFKAYKSVSCVMVEKDSQIDIDFKGKAILSKDNKKDFYHLTTIKNQSSKIILVDDIQKITSLSKIIPLYKLSILGDAAKTTKPEDSFFNKIKKLIPKKSS